jgi:hypothetical protein
MRRIFNFRPPSPPAARGRRAIVGAALFLLAATVPAPLQRFLTSLSPSLRSKATIPFTDEERFDWHYVPRSREGVATGDLSTAQRDLLHEVLRAGLSANGYTKANGILELEPILGRLEGSRFRDPDRYHFSLFGDPSKAPWGWRFEGHHLSINATHTPRGTSMTPMFLGANPARVPDGPRAGWEVLGEEERLGRAMFVALDSEQRQKALTSNRAPRDIVTGTNRMFTLRTFEGLPASEMTPAQRDQLQRLIMLYVGNAPKETADAELARLRESGLGKVHFAWAGGMGRGQAHYYRIHGPTILIEYDNTQDGANHIHTVWRSPDRDFGGDLLARHYAEADHHAARSVERGRPRPRNHPQSGASYPHAHTHRRPDPPPLHSGH